MIGKLKNLFEQIVYSKEDRARRAGVELGKNNFIASDFWSTEPYLIKVGSNCQITSGVKLLTHGGGGAVRLTHSRFDCFGRVTVGDYVYIGTNALIMPGVTIGDNVLIAAGSVVTGSVPSNVVVGGNPAKVICTLEQYLQRNLDFNLNSKEMDAQEKKRLLLSVDSSRLIQKRYLKI